MSWKEKEWVNINLHTYKSFPQLLSFIIPYRFFFLVVQEGLFLGKKKGANPQSPSERTELGWIKFSWALLLFLLDIVALSPLSSFLVSQCCCYFFILNINGFFCCLHFVLHSAFNSLWLFERKDAMNLIVLSLSNFSSIRAEGSSQVRPYAFQSDYERNFNAAFIMKSSNNNDLKLNPVMG